MERVLPTTASTHSISVLIPTRKRPAKLHRSIASVIERADDPSGLQILIGHDNDDDETKNYIAGQLADYLKTWNVDCHSFSFERMGYAKLNEYYNYMALYAACDWFLCWGDDSEIVSQGWDTKIRNYNGQFKLLAFDTHNHHPYSIFPVVPRDWVTCLGKFARHQMIDADVSQIAYLLDIMERTDIKADHNRFDLVGEQPDETYQQRQLFEGKPNDSRDLNHADSVQWRYMAAERLAWYLNLRGINTDFWTGVKLGTQDPWLRMKENDINNQTVSTVTA